MSRKTTLDPTIATAPARRIGVVADPRRERAGARPDGGGDETRAHEDEAGLQRPPAEHVLEVEGGDEVERRRRPEQEQRAEVRADQQSRAEDPEADERLLDRALDGDEQRDQDGGDHEGAERSRRCPAGGRRFDDRPDEHEERAGHGQRARDVQPAAGRRVAIGSGRTTRSAASSRTSATGATTANV